MLVSCDIVVHENGSQIASIQHNCWTSGQAGWTIDIAKYQTSRNESCIIFREKVKELATIQSWSFEEVHIDKRVGASLVWVKYDQAKVCNSRNISESNVLKSVETRSKGRSGSDWEKVVADRERVKEIDTRVLIPESELIAVRVLHTEASSAHRRSYLYVF